MDAHVLNAVVLPEARRKKVEISLQRVQKVQFTAVVTLVACTLTGENPNQTFLSGVGSPFPMQTITETYYYTLAEGNIILSEACYAMKETFQHQQKQLSQYSHFYFFAVHKLV